METNNNSIRRSTKHIANGKMMTLRNTVTVMVVCFFGFVQGQPAYRVTLPSGAADIAFASELK